MKRSIYLDNAATTAIDPEVIKAMVPVMEACYGNPSSTHHLGRKSKSQLEMARKSVARHLNCIPREIFFTSGGTEADNMALTCAVRDLGVSHVITTELEHHAVGHTTDHFKKHNLSKVSHVKIDNKGNVDLEDLARLIQEHEGKSMVSLMHANNEIGTLLPLEDVTKLCRELGAYFHSDTVQTMAHYRYDLQKLDIDFITCSAHKFHGPKGVGFLYINKNLNVDPLIHGGSQERERRGGTENLYGIVGLSKAMDVAYADLDDHRNHIEDLKSHMIEKLQSSIDGVSFNGESADMNKSLYTVLSVSLPESPLNSILLFNLDIYGICVSGGSACSSGSNKGSHVLEGIGADMDRPAIRFSFSKYNTIEELDYAVEKIASMYETVAV